MSEQPDTPPARRFDDGQMAVAHVYAEALLGLAEERGLAEAMLAELEGLEQVIAVEPRTARFLSSPLVDRGTRRRVLESAFRGSVSDLLTDALQVVLRKGRLELLPAIIESYRREFDRRRGRVDVAVRTAVPLTDEQRRSLEQAITRSTGKSPRLHERVDQELLGGMIVQIGDRKFDSSLSTQLSRLQKALGARASDEIIRRQQESAGDA